MNQVFAVKRRIKAQSESRRKFERGKTVTSGSRVTSSIRTARRADECERISARLHYGDSHDPEELDVSRGYRGVQVRARWTCGPKLEERAMRRRDKPRNYAPPVAKSDYYYYY